MLFSVGVKTPKKGTSAYGLIVPALSIDQSVYVSATGSQDEIAIVIRDVILLTLEKRLINPFFSVEDIKDAGFIVYSNNVEYSYCDAWLVIDVDLSAFEGKQHRISIVLPDCLLTRIDYVVQNNNVVYRDRSHFFAKAAQHELSHYHADFPLAVR